MKEISSNGRVEKGHTKCDLCTQLFSVRCIITFRTLFLLNCQFLHEKVKAYALLRGGIREPRGLFHFSLLIVKSLLMVRIGVGLLRLQLLL